jgi:hypothetical protein
LLNTGSFRQTKVEEIDFFEFSRQAAKAQRRQEISFYQGFAPLRLCGLA